jgi:hypothetical protein
MLALASLWGLRIFLFLVTILSVRHGLSLFLQKHAWSHRVAGGALFAWIALGASLVPLLKEHARITWFIYDVTLGICGITATLTAARDFPHKYIKNPKGQSGTLSERAIVTHSEMVEHSFYQGLNLCQAVYLHAMSYFGEEWSTLERLLALWVATMPWWIRNRFPVHSFSNNWKQTPKDEQTKTELLLYRIKKMQYLFYKHAILFGINISVALTPSSRQHGIPLATPWRIFWLALNASYGMEFFLQTMVRRKALSQVNMLWLQRLLMTASTLSAIVAVFPHLHSSVFCASLVLNLLNRHHNVLNTMLIAVIAVCISGGTNQAAE